MKRGSGKSKGSAFEREQSKLLSLWWTNNERDDVFWRTQSSGGRATQRESVGKQTKYQYGDITFSDPVGEPLIALLNFECKCYRVVDFLGVLCKGDCEFQQFWRQCCGDAKLSHREPVLILHINRGKTCMFVNRYLYLKLDQQGFRPSRKLVAIVGDKVIVGFLQEEFFEQMDPEVFRSGTQDT